MFQRFLHADVQRRAPELAARLKQEGHSKYSHSKYGYSKYSHSK